jgi:hypothetical protein
MNTEVIKKQIEELQNKLKEVEKKEKRKEYLRIKQKDFYEKNKDKQRERCRNKQREYYSKQKTPDGKLITAYILIEELKTMKPECVDELKLVLNS